jgi:hypothetical protein
MENQKNEIEPIINQTNNLDITDEDQERYDFLFETAKTENPGVCTYLIHMCCVEQIAEEKNELPTDEQINEIAEKYKSKPGHDEEYNNMISFQKFDDE